MRTCADWGSREYTELMAGSIKRIADFLSAFDASCRGRLALLNEKLCRLERKVAFLEATLEKSEENEDDEDDKKKKKDDEELIDGEESQDDA